MEKLSDDVKQYQSERADQKIERVAGEELVAPAVLSNVAEQEYQYGAEAFEASQKVNVKKIAEKTEEHSKAPIKHRSR